MPSSGIQYGFYRRLNAHFHQKEDIFMSRSVVAVCTSLNKGERKKPVPTVELVVEHGILGDAHAGDWHRQVSLLAQESIDKMRAMGLSVSAGDFAENITTTGIDLVSLPIGSRLALGPALLEVTQIGKECHTRCAIFYQAGDCVMPKEGIFARVLQGGIVVPDTPIQLVAP
jgi:MOSC domain-containing protein YiiM